VFVLAVAFVLAVVVARSFVCHSAAQRRNLLLARVPIHPPFLSHRQDSIALVALGVIVTLSSILRHIQLIHELSSGAWQPGRVSRDAVILGLILAAIGIGMAIYLILVR
jgi:hypothetical protein